MKAAEALMRAGGLGAKLGAIVPEETRVHVGPAVTRDLLQLSGLHPRLELRDLTERFGMLP